MMKWLKVAALLVVFVLILARCWGCGQRWPVIDDEGNVTVAGDVDVVAEDGEETSGGNISAEGNVTGQNLISNDDADVHDDVHIGDDARIDDALVVDVIYANEIHVPEGGIHEDLEELPTDEELDANDPSDNSNDNDNDNGNDNGEPPVNSGFSVEIVEPANGAVFQLGDGFNLVVRVAITGDPGNYTVAVLFPDTNRYELIVGYTGEGPYEFVTTYRVNPISNDGVVNGGWDGTLAVKVTPPEGDFKTASAHIVVEAN